MTLLFCDGFDSYATADITKKWTSVNNSVSIGATGRRGGGGMVCAAANRYVSKTLTSTASWVFGFAMNAVSLPSGSTTILQLIDSGTVQCALLFNLDGTLSVVRSTSTAVTGGTSVAVISAGAFNYIEFKVTIADSIGVNTCKVRINGVDAITVTTGQDLKATSNASANSFSFGAVGASSPSFIFDDFYICDQSGGMNNDFLGDCRIDTIYPTSDGNYSQFTCSTGSSHFALVDETAPNTSDYNSATTASNRDSYGMGNLTALASQTVYGVQVNAAVLKDDAGIKTVATFVRSGSTNSADGATVALGTSQVYVSQVFEQDPAVSAAWTETTVNSMEAGLKIIA